MEWKRTYDLSILKHSRASVCRTFRNGRSVLILEVYDDYMGDPGVKISVSRQDGSDQNSYGCNLPAELIGELEEMLQGFKTK